MCVYAHACKCVRACVRVYVCISVCVCVCVCVNDYTNLVLPALILGIFPDGVDENCLHAAHCVGHRHPRGAIALTVIADKDDRNIWIFPEKFLDVFLLVFLVLSVVERDGAVHAAFKVKAVAACLVRLVVADLSGVRVRSRVRVRIRVRLLGGIELGLG